MDSVFETAVTADIEDVVNSVRRECGKRTRSIALVGSALSSPSPRDIDLVVVIEDADLEWADLRSKALDLHALAGRSSSVDHPISIRLFGSGRLAEAANCDGFRIRSLQIDGRTLWGENLLDGVDARLTKPCLRVSFAIHHLYWMVLAEARGYDVELSWTKLEDRFRVNAELLEVDPEVTRSWFMSTKIGRALRSGVMLGNSGVLHAVADWTLSHARHEWTHRGNDYSEAIETVDLSNLSRRAPLGWT